LIISMDDSEAGSLEQIRAFLAGSGEVRFAGQGREEVYGSVEQTLVRQEYASLDKPDKGLVRRYIVRMTGLSRAQVTRLITAYGKTGPVKAAAYQRTKFATRYTTADVNLLAYVDKAHGNLSGPATRRILEREYAEYGQAAYQRLSGISVAHLYRLRNSEGYRKRNTSYQPTRPAPIPIGERRKEPTTSTAADVTGNSLERPPRCRRSPPENAAPPSGPGGRRSNSRSNTSAAPSVNKTSQLVPSPRPSFRVPRDIRNPPASPDVPLRTKPPASHAPCRCWPARIRARARAMAG
jgi:hypothetical protein